MTALAAKANCADEAHVMRSRVVDTWDSDVAGMLTTVQALLSCWTHGLAGEDDPETVIDVKQASSEQLATYAICELLARAKQVGTGVGGSAAVELRVMHAWALMASIESALWNVSQCGPAVGPTLGELAIAGRHVIRLVESCLCELRDGAASKGDPS